MQPKIGQNPDWAGPVPEILGRCGPRVGVRCNVPASSYFVRALYLTASAARYASWRHSTRRAWKSVSQKVSFHARHDTFSGRKCLSLGILRQASAPRTLESRLPACVSFVPDESGSPTRATSHSSASKSLSACVPRNLASVGRTIRVALFSPPSHEGICYLTLAICKDAVT